MFRKTHHRHKPNLSEHQKQIRFFTRLSLVVAVALAVLVFWLLNRSSFDAP